MLRTLENPMELKLSYEGIHFDVTGEPVPFHPPIYGYDPQFCEPAYGGYVDDLTIKHEKDDITLLLDERVVCDIEQLFLKEAGCGN